MSGLIWNHSSDAFGTAISDAIPCFQLFDWPRGGLFPRLTSPPYCRPYRRFARGIRRIVPWEVTPHRCAVVRAASPWSWGRGVWHGADEVREIDDRRPAFLAWVVHRSLLFVDPTAARFLSLRGRCRGRCANHATRTCEPSLTATCMTPKTNPELIKELYTNT